MIPVLKREIMALLGLTLGHRHLDLLQVLLSYPLLHVQELAALLEREVSSIERYLRVLQSSGCIEPIATSLGQRWRLNERGLRLMATAHHLKIQCIASSEENDGCPNLVQQGVDVLLRHLEHTVGIYGFFASLTQAASQERTQGREHRLLWWETGAACERRYRDHEHWHNLRPDAFAAYQAGEQRVRFWLEWDRATMGTRDLGAKLQNLRALCDLTRVVQARSGLADAVARGSRPRAGNAFWSSSNSHADRQVWVHYPYHDLDTIA